MGRPSEFTQGMADRICEGLIDGKSLRTICREDEMPSTSAVCRWLKANGAFREQYAQARELQADALFDDILDIADGVAALRGGSDPDVARDRLSVDARKWMAGKLQAKKYGDKVLNEHSGLDGKPIESTFTVEFVRANGNPAP